MENLGQPNIIVRRYKKGKHGHHGGAWKVAMADFALAMMALFLVLWIISSTDEEQRASISGYFQDPRGFEQGQRVPSPYVIDMGGSPSEADNIALSESLDPEKILQANEIESMADSIEYHRMQLMQQQLQAEITASATLSPFQDQLLLDITKEGLRLQIIDKTNRPMFDVGSARLRFYSEDILWELAPILATLDHRLSITGHTDASPSPSRNEDDVNWRLSATRADAARRALMEAGVPKSQIAQVIGMGDTAPLDVNDPGSEQNRRISIVLLNRRADAGVSGRIGQDSQPKPGEVVPNENDERLPVINRTGTMIERLQREREARDNPYDNPPNEQEAFW